MSSSIRFMSLVGLAALALSSVACMQAAPSDGDNDGSTNKKGGFFSPKADGETNDGADTNGESATGTSGTCEAACDHYLECKGAAMNTAQNKATCTTNCKGLGLKSSDLASFVQSDCATAIQMVDGNAGQQQGSSSSGGSSSGGGRPSECNGCVKDGDSCIWLSQSNWGQGAYSGAAASCESYCCQ
jgi:hypothetical protein